VNRIFRRFAHVPLRLSYWRGRGGGFYPLR
jgi:hypothetical protein